MAYRAGLARIPFSIPLTRRCNLVTCIRGKREYNLGSLVGKDIQESLRKNPFFERYKSKLQDALSFLLRFLSNHPGTAGSSTEATQPDQGDAGQSVSERSTSHSPLPRASFMRPPRLSDVMHLDMVVGKTAKEIAEIWKAYHSDKDRICAAIPADKYNKLYARSQECPQFVYPLPRNEGYEMVFSQFSGHRCFFTSLLQYKTFQDSAPPCLTLTHYVDLAGSKALVLMSGEMDTKMLSVMDAQFLANQVQLYYASEDDSRQRLVTQFNSQPDAFDYTKLFEHLQTSLHSHVPHTENTV